MHADTCKYLHSTQTATMNVKIQLCCQDSEFIYCAMTNMMIDDRYTELGFHVDITKSF